MNLSTDIKMHLDKDQLPAVNTQSNFIHPLPQLNTWTILLSHFPGTIEQDWQIQNTSDRVIPIGPITDTFIMTTEMIL